MARVRWGDTQTRAARKRHWCDWCFERIEPGEKYSYYFGPTVDGDVGQYRRHRECREARHPDTVYIESIRHRTGDTP